MIPLMFSKVLGSANLIKIAYDNSPIGIPITILIVSELTYVVEIYTITAINIDIVKIGIMSANCILIVKGTILEERNILIKRFNTLETIDPKITPYKPKLTEIIRMEIPITFLIISNLRNMSVRPVT